MDRELGQWDDILLMVKECGRWRDDWKAEEHLYVKLDMVCIAAVAREWV
jgi:hypothetical protein